MAGTRLGIDAHDLDRLQLRLRVLASEIKHVAAERCDQQQDLDAARATGAMQPQTKAEARAFERNGAVSHGPPPDRRR